MGEDWSWPHAGWGTYVLDTKWGGVTMFRCKKQGERGLWIHQLLDSEHSPELQGVWVEGQFVRICLLRRNDSCAAAKSKDRSSSFTTVSTSTAYGANNDNVNYLRLCGKRHLNAWLFCESSTSKVCCHDEEWLIHCKLQVQVIKHTSK